MSDQPAQKTIPLDEAARAVVAIAAAMRERADDMHAIWDVRVLVVRANLPAELHAAVMRELDGRYSSWRRNQ